MVCYLAEPPSFHVEAGPEAEPEPELDGVRDREGKGGQETFRRPANWGPASSEGRKTSCRGGAGLRMRPQMGPGDLGRYGGQCGT